MAGADDTLSAELAEIIRRLPQRPKGWREIMEALKALPVPEARAEVWRQALALCNSMEDAEAKHAFAADLAGRLFRWLGEAIQRIDPADPATIEAAWRLVRRLYSDPGLGELGGAHPDAFLELVRLSGRDPQLKSLVPHGSDLSPCVVEAIAAFAVEPWRSELRTLCRTEMATAHGGLDAASERAARLLQDPEFHRPVVICGFHHSGTRLLARQLAALGVRQRVNLYQYEWSYVVQLNSILEPGCMDPARLGAGGEDPSLLSPRRLAFRMALEGLQPGQTWGFKDPRNGLTARAWLKAFPEARVVHLLRDPVATIGTLPAEYGRFVRTDAGRPTAALFWIDLWRAYVDRAREAMAESTRSMEIRFEDLCADPAGVLAAVVESIGLPPAIGPELLEAAPIQAGKAGLRDRLRGELAPEDFAALEAAGRRYGY